jgi:membrane fusion protein, multidrug efflux system
MRVAAALSNTVVIAACVAGAAWFYRADLATRFPVLKAVVVERLGLDPALFEPRPDAATDDASRGQARNGKGGNVPVMVLSAVAIQEDVPITKRGIGFVESTAIVNVRSRIDSQILEEHVTDGQFVKKGDLLFVLDDREIRAQIARDDADLARDAATLAKVQGDLARNRQLLSRNAGTQQAVDQATADVKSATAVMAADQAVKDADTLKLAYARIVAPIDGRIGAVQVAPGNLVSNGGGGSSLVTITTMSPVRVTFTLPERELQTLKAMIESPDQSVVKVTTLGAKTGLGTKTGEVVGKLDFLDSAVDATSGTIAAKASFANADLALWPGQYVDIVLSAGLLEAAVTVPTPAVQQSQKGPFVYVIRPDATVEMRPVTVALVAGDRTAIATGLVTGETVVIEGQLRLKEGSPIKQGDSAPAVTGQLPQDNQDAAPMPNVERPASPAADSGPRQHKSGSGRRGDGGAGP